MEQQAVGSVSWGVYKSYLQAVQNRFYVIVIIVMFVVVQFGLSGLDIFLAQWVKWEERIAANHIKENVTGLDEGLPNSLNVSSTNNSYFTEASERENYILIYTILMGVVASMYIHRTFAFYAMCLRASINLHDQIFRAITRTAMFFYNNNPSGRILNRFAKDITSIDVVLPTSLMDCIAVSLYFMIPRIVKKNASITVTFGTVGHCDNCINSQLLAFDTNTDYGCFTVYASIYLHKLVQKFEKN